MRRIARKIDIRATIASDPFAWSASATKIATTAKCAIPAVVAAFRGRNRYRVSRSGLTLCGTGGGTRDALANRRPAFGELERTEEGAERRG